MRIGIIALGSRGDIQPLIALGAGLHAAGHFVRLITNENYAAPVRAQGLDFWPVSGDVQAVAQSDEMRALLEKGNFLAINRLTAVAVQEAALDWAREALDGGRDVDLLLAGVGGLFLAVALAEKLNIPLIQSYVVPFTPTTAFSGALLPPALGRFSGANRLTHHLTRQMMWQAYRTADTRARREVLNLPPASFWGPYATARMHSGPVLYGFSTAVIPRPSNWDANQHVTGFWFLDAGPDWTPPPALVDFLQRGDPPLTIGFGSMIQPRPQETADLILQALAQTGQRAVILSGWGDYQMADLPDTVFVAEAVPHDWLFPRAAAVVHHGGAGTTAAGLRAGVPSILVPFFGDQPFWGQRVADLGVGPQPIRRAKLTADRLSAAIHAAVSDATMRARAAALGAQIQAEDGVRRAVEVIERVALRDIPPAPPDPARRTNRVRFRRSQDWP